MPIHDMRSIVPLPPWRRVQLPPEVLSVPTMLMQTELQLLLTVARDHFRNEGFIVDAGAFLGGSTAALGAGLLANPRYRENPRKGAIVSYDFFQLWGTAAKRFFPPGTPEGTDFLPKFQANTAFIGNALETRPGDITQTGPVPAPVEILFIDVAKSPTINDWVVRHFFPALIPGHSLVIQQDYLWTGWNGWIHATMEHYSDHFEMLDHTESNSVVFRYVKPIPAGEIPEHLVETMSRSRILELQANAMSRFTGRQRDILAESRRQLEEYLAKSHQTP